MCNGGVLGIAWQSFAELEVCPGADSVRTRSAYSTSKWAFAKACYHLSMMQAVHDSTIHMVVHQCAAAHGS